ncbi:hypothetical protein N2152v2_001751 [Parachlorella kessleri]
MAATLNGSAGLNALTASEGDVREKAASGLVEELVASQQQFEQESELESDEEPAGTANGKGGKGKAVDRALRRCSPLLTYAVKRLVKGLASGRQGARQGFALALTLALGRAGSSISAQGAAVVVKGVLEASGSSKVEQGSHLLLVTVATQGGEQRDMLLGQIFGFGAVVRSGLALDAAAGREIAAGLVHVAEKKSFLREAAAAVLLELAEGLGDEALAAVVGEVDGLKAWMTAPPESASPEALLLAVRVWGRLPAAVAAACPLLPPGCKPPPPTLFTDPSVSAARAAEPAAAALFSEAHLELLVPVLRGSTQSHPRLHGVWPTLLALLIPGFNPDKEQRQSESGHNAPPRTCELEALWGSVVERELFVSSHERKYLGFMLFRILLPHLKSEHIPLVFTPNFLRCLSNNLSKADSHLNAAASKCLDRITAFAEKADAGVRVAVTLALQRHGGAGFEKLTKAKKAGPMLEGVEGQALQSQIAQVQSTFCAAAAGNRPSTANGQQQEEGGAEDTEQEEEGAAAAAASAQPPAQQQWAVEQLCSLCRLPAATVGDKLAVLRFLALHAFLRLDPKAAAAKGKDKELKAASQCSAELAPAARRLCAARLIALADALSKPPSKASAQHAQQQKQGKGGPATAQQPSQHARQQAQQQQHDFVSDVVAYIDRAGQAPGAALVAEEASEAAEQALGALRLLRQALAKRLQADNASAEAAPRLKALQHLAGLLTLQALGDPQAADASAAQDLEHIYRVAFEGAELAGEGSDGGEQAPHWMDTLMDVLLALLAQTSASLPSAPLREAVEHVFRVFCDQLTPTGMQDMLRVIGRPVQQSQGEEGIFDSEEEGEEGGDAASSEDEEGGGSDGESSDEEGEEEGSSSGGEEETKAAEDGAASSEDEEGMSDEAMFRMDAKLAAYFAAAKQSKRGARAQREELLNFKLRVIALLDAFIKKVPGSPLLPTAVLPLLAALVSSSGGGLGGGVQQVVAERLAGLVQNKLCKSRAEASGAADGGVSEDDLAAALRRCLYLASRSPEARLRQVASAAYVYLLRVAAGAAGSVGSHPKAAESLSAALRDLFTKKRTRLGRPFFEALLRPPLSLGPLLLPLLLDHAAAARSDYQRAEVLSLLAAVLKSRSPEVDRAAAAHAASVGSVVTEVLTRPYDKAQRQVEALKTACQLLESLARGGGALSREQLDPAEQAATAAAAGSPAPKVQGQLLRLSDLLRDSGIGGEADAKQGGKAGSKQVLEVGAAAEEARQPGKGGGGSKKARDGRVGGGKTAKRAKK